MRLVHSMLNLGIAVLDGPSKHLGDPMVELADVAVKVARLGEAALAQAAGVRLLAGVDHGVPSQVVGVLETLAAASAGVGLLARMGALVPLEGVQAGEGLAALLAGGLDHPAHQGGQLGGRPAPLLEVGLQVQLQKAGVWKGAAAEGAGAKPMQVGATPPRRGGRPAGCRDVAVLLLLLLFLASLHQGSASLCQCFAPVRIPVLPSFFPFPFLLSYLRCLGGAPGAGPEMLSLSVRQHTIHQL